MHWALPATPYRPPSWNLCPSFNLWAWPTLPLVTLNFNKALRSYSLSSSQRCIPCFWVPFCVIWVSRPPIFFFHCYLFGSGVQAWSPPSPPEIQCLTRHRQNPCPPTRHVCMLRPTLRGPTPGSFYPGAQLAHKMVFVCTTCKMLIQASAAALLFRSRMTLSQLKITNVYWSAVFGWWDWGLKYSKTKQTMLTAPPNKER